MRLFLIRSNIIKLLFVIISVSGYNSLYAQWAVCTDSTQQTCKCSTAPLLCSIDELDGYTFDMSTYQHQNDGPSPICPTTGTLTNNPYWLSFKAWCTNIDLKLSFSNCTIKGSVFGTQIVVYSDCTNYTPVSCDPICGSTDDKIIAINGLIIGETYYMMIDGCNGTTCHIVIDVLGTCGGPTIGNWPGPISGETNICNKDSTIYIVPEPDGANIFHWYLNGTSIYLGKDSSINIDWTNQPNGNYVLCVDAFNDSCVSENSFPPPECINISYFSQNAKISSNSPVCSGMDIILNSNNGDFYSWTGPDGFTSTIQNPIIQNATLINNGVYYVTISNQNGCTAIDSTIVIVNPSPVPNIKGSSIVCNDTTTILDAGVGFNSYLWNTGATTQTIQVDSSGTYVVTVGNFFGCLANDTIIVSFGSLPVFTLLSFSESCVDSCDGKIKVIPDNPEYKYLWSNLDTTNLITNLCPGLYSVTVTNLSGCFASDTTKISDPIPISIFIQDGDSILIALVNGGLPPYTYLWYTGETTDTIYKKAGNYCVTVTDSYSCTQVSCDTTVNINYINTQQHGYKIYPNPSSDKIYLQNVNGTNLSSNIIYCRIINFQGQELKRYNYLPDKIDLSDFISGTYNLQLIFNERLISLKFIVLH